MLGNRLRIEHVLNEHHQDESTHCCPCVRFPLHIAREALWDHLAENRKNIAPAAKLEAKGKMGRKAATAKRAGITAMGRAKLENIDQPTHSIR